MKSSTIIVTTKAEKRRQEEWLRRSQKGNKFGFKDKPLTPNIIRTPTKETT